MTKKIKIELTLAEIQQVLLLCGNSYADGEWYGGPGFEAGRGCESKRRAYLNAAKKLENAKKILEE